MGTSPRTTLAEFTPSIAPSNARAPLGRALRTPKGRERGLALFDHLRAFLVGLPRPLGRASTTKLATFDLQIVHWDRRFDTSSGPSSSTNSSSYLSFKCVVVNRSRTLQACRIYTHESLKSFTGALLVTCTFGSGSITPGRVSGRQVEFSCLSRACSLPQLVPQTDQRPSCRSARTSRNGC